MDAKNVFTFYFDWNIISSFKRINELPDKKLAESLSLILGFISNAPSNFYFPYSNAHLRDLLNGYPENQDYVDTDLNLLSQISRNVCITQYWGEAEPKFHSRDVQQHFWDIESDKDMQTKSLEEYVNGVSPMLGAVVALYSNVPFFFRLPSDANPVFRRMFGNALKEQTMLGLMKDIFELHKTMFSDYTLYKELRGELHKQFILSRSGKKPQEVLKALESNLEKKEFQPVKELAEKTYSKNAFYDKYITTYTQLDKFTVLKEKLSKSNTYKQIFNDAMHSFYGAHCDCFITNDSGTFEKSQVLYHKYNIPTKLFKPSGFAEFLREYQIQTA